MRAGLIVERGRWRERAPLPAPCCGWAGGWVVSLVAAQYMQCTPQSVRPQRCGAGSKAFEIYCLSLSGTCGASVVCRCVWLWCIAQRVSMHTPHLQALAAMTARMTAGMAAGMASTSACRRSVRYFCTSMYAAVAACRHVIPNATRQELHLLLCPRDCRQMVPGVFAAAAEGVQVACADVNC
jgi:hypothetical protein